MTKDPARTFSREIKLKVVERLEGGETIAALARELSVHRQLIYKWRDAHRAGRLGARRGRPTKAEALLREARLGETDALAAAQRKIAELERKVGQQAVELDFFQGALRRIKASRPLND
ncbi:MAG TPA: transposase [Caulobacteraceae bacterium]